MNYRIAPPPPSPDHKPFPDYGGERHPLFHVTRTVEQRNPSHWQGPGEPRRIDMLVKRVFLFGMKISEEERVLNISGHYRFDVL